MTFQTFNPDPFRSSINFGNSNSNNNETPQVHNMEKAQEGPGREKGCRILIVEDELLVAENVKEIVESFGYQVIGVIASGEEVIANFEKLNPDLILMDIRLSGSIDGIQTAVAIHYTVKEVPIIFLTAYAEDQFPHLAAVPTPLFKYVSKPCNADELKENISELLKRTGMNTQ